MAQRIHALAVDGFKSDQLLEKARELHEHLRRLEGDKYDLEQRFKRQQYDVSLYTFVTKLIVILVHVSSLLIFRLLINVYCLFSPRN